jgi:beta-aspartyl-peptidase (threonine type)
MTKIAIIVHGGASELTPLVKENIEEIEAGLSYAVKVGYAALHKGRNSLTAVEKAVMALEDHPLFNAGRGSALNNKGEVEMDAAIMYGKNLQAGAVSMVRTVKNPINLARVVMSKTKHVLLSGYGALDLATLREVTLEPESYFLTEHQYQEYLHNNRNTSRKAFLKRKMHGTVGAVALDKLGNIASATSTGGTSNCLPGRIGDSCIIGAGCYANNNTCAVSGTGEGEHLIRGVVAHTISMLVELKGYSLQKACDEVIRQRNKNFDIGVIALNPKGKMGISFNTEIMKRGWKTSADKKTHVKIYR